MAITQEPRCLAQTWQLKREGRDTDKWLPSPTLLCLLGSGVPLSPSIQWIQSPQPQGLTLTSVLSLIRPLQFIIMSHGPTSHKVLTSPTAARHSSQSKNLSLPPLNRWPCFCHGSSLPWD